MTLNAARAGAVIALLIFAGVSTTHAQDERPDSTAARHDAIATLLNDAAQRVEQRDFDAASAAVERALRIDPDDASLWRLLAEVRQRQGRTAQANVLLAKADAIAAKESQLSAAPAEEVSAESTQDRTEITARVYRAPARFRQRDGVWMRSQTALAQALAEYRAAEKRDTALHQIVSDQHRRIEELSARLREAQLDRERLLAELRTPAIPAQADPSDRYRHWKRGSPKAHGHALAHKHRRGRHRRAWPKRHATYRIPNGHLPPPGLCRAWFPNRPPGHQPPPAPCHTLRHGLPPGAILIGQN